jgi:hypothetical protein
MAFRLASNDSIFSNRDKATFPARKTCFGLGL